MATRKMVQVAQPTNSGDLQAEVSTDGIIDGELGNPPCVSFAADPEIITTVNQGTPSRYAFVDTASNKVMGIYSAPNMPVRPDSQYSVLLDGYPSSVAVGYRYSSAIDQFIIG